MNASDRTNAAFGRRGREVPAQAVPAQDGAAPTHDIGHVVGLLALASLLLGVIGFGCWTASGIAAMNAESARAEQRVIDIVNQPVTHLPRSGPVELFSPGWFHDGAIKPDFNNVDIRTTQEFPYAGADYSSSDLNPSEMFVGRELEFNSMTKYFYTDRTVPKKRLSEAEMVEINGLYRTIGRDEQALLKRWLMMAALVVAGFCLGLALLPLLGRPADGPLSDNRLDWS